MKILIFSFFVVFVFLQSCKLKDSCQVNHTGDVCVTNSNDVKVDIYINSTKVFTLDPGETKCVTQPVGTYDVRYVNNDSGHFDDYEGVAINECKKTEITVNFYE